jgi:dUTPase
MILKTINDGESIAQITVSTFDFADMVEVKEPASANRGAGGFGHTDNNNFS